jgi:hypothetical protein
MTNLALTTTIVILDETYGLIAQKSQVSSRMTNWEV